MEALLPELQELPEAVGTLVVRATVAPDGTVGTVRFLTNTLVLRPWSEGDPESLRLGIQAAVVAHVTACTFPQSKANLVRQLRKPRMDVQRDRILIIGAAGRDFHQFNTQYRTCDTVDVVGFTAAQIPHIDNRRYPAILAGPAYPKGLPIWPEHELETIIADHHVNCCVLAYSDLEHSKVMQLAARCAVAGADFTLPQPFKSMLPSSKPVIAVTAVRTGCGKSQTSAYIIDTLRSMGLSSVLVRHPMPYDQDLAKQAVQRFATVDDLDVHNVTIEEREEYEQHIARGVVVYAGVDYEAILRAAEQEADVVVWDGGNNDTPFFKPDLWLVVTDPLRAGHEERFYPGDVNFRAADVIVVNKANSASEGAIEQIRAAARRLNPDAEVVVVDSRVHVDRPDLVRNKRVLCVEDGPTLTHGGMPFGAGFVAAKALGAAEVVDPRAAFVGTLADTYRIYPTIGKLVPAMGYFAEQVRDLEATINAVDCDTVLVATPTDLRRVVHINRPVAVATYAVVDRAPPLLRDVVTKHIQAWGKREGPYAVAHSPRGGDKAFPPFA